VGQNAIREALITLAHAGFVRRVANKATYVTEITPDEGRKIARVRQALEGLVVDLILERLENEDLDFSASDEHLCRMRTLLQARDIAAFYGADIDFHRALWSLADNQHLSQLLEQIVVPLFAFFIMVNRDPETNWEEIWEATEIHARIVEGLKKRSFEKAHAAVDTLLAASLHFSKPREEVRPELVKRIRAKRAERKSSD